MSREYVIALVDDLVEARFPSGTEAMRVLAGRPYLASEAFVEQNPTLFRPIEDGDEVPAG